MLGTIQDILGGLNKCSGQEREANWRGGLIERGLKREFMVVQFSVVVGGEIANKYIL